MRRILVTIVIITLGMISRRDRFGIWRVIGGLPRRAREISVKKLPEIAKGMGVFAYLASGIMTEPSCRGATLWAAGRSVMWRSYATHGSSHLLRRIGRIGHWHSCAGRSNFLNRLRRLRIVGVNVGGWLRRCATCAIS